MQLNLACVGPNILSPLRTKNALFPVPLPPKKRTKKNTINTILYDHTYTSHLSGNDFIKGSLGLNIVGTKLCGDFKIQE